MHRNSLQLLRLECWQGKMMLAFVKPYLMAMRDVYKRQVLIHPNMGFIAKVPCVALLDLMCIRIPLFLLVLGGRCV